jgi:glycosyltransferase involved in cell wall biosynthesis
MSGSPGVHDPLRLLAIGRLERQKDFTLAIDTLAAVRRQRPATLAILGEGRQRALLERRIATLGLGDCVQLAGHVSPVTPWLRDHDLLLMTSLFEGVPAVVGEALCQGLPFIATDCSPWLTALSRSEPSLGTVAPDRTPGALAQALIARSSQPYPAAEVIERAVGAHRIGRAALDYLALFDRLRTE